MVADKTCQTITLRDGRTLGFAEYGDPVGKAVFHFNGSGGSRLEYPMDKSILTDLGIRFIATDQPGHGLSDPLACAFKLQRVLAGAIISGLAPPDVPIRTRGCLFPTVG